MWIGLGSMDKNKKVVVLNSREDELAFTPETQSKFFKTPPRVPMSNLALLQRNGSMMLSVMDLYYEQIETSSKVTDDDEVEGDNSDATIICNMRTFNH
jgi:hypothetical protein